jgi:hypothetical protein
MGNSSSSSLDDLSLVLYPIELSDGSKIAVQLRSTATLKDVRFQLDQNLDDDTDAEQVGKEFAFQIQQRDASDHLRILRHQEGDLKLESLLKSGYQVKVTSQGKRPLADDSNEKPDASCQSPAKKIRARESLIIEETEERPFDDPAVVSPGQPRPFLEEPAPAALHEQSPQPPGVPPQGAATTPANDLVQSTVSPTPADFYESSKATTEIIPQDGDEGKNVMVVFEISAN